MFCKLQFANNGDGASREVRPGFCARHHNAKVCASLCQHGPIEVILRSARRTMRCFMHWRTDRTCRQVHHLRDWMHLETRGEGMQARGEARHPQLLPRVSRQVLSWPSALHFKTGPSAQHSPTSRPLLRSSPRARGILPHVVLCRSADASATVDGSVACPAALPPPVLS